MKLSKEELNVLLNLVKHEIEWAGQEAFYKEYKKQLNKIEDKITNELNK